MNITIIGWYGTETVGDRGILAGILDIINISEVDNIFLGSLYPFFTERTLSEDYYFYENYFGFNKKIKLFNSKKSKELKNAIKKSDFVIMGGGPLMHISSLYLITYAFNFSKKQGKKNIILGSGVGPIFYKKYKKELCKIFSLSDNIILRDKSSKNYALKIHQDVGIQINKKISVSYDPSIISCYNFLKNIRDSKQTKNYDIIVNLRDFPLEYASNEKQISQAKENLSFFISYLNNLEKKVLLLPNHYFSVGGDDREYFNLLKFKYNLNNNIDVQNKPLNLEETLLAIKNSEKGIGMRFHSILFQTIVNNKNFVLDYAEPEKGKIYGFLKDINFNFNKNYINIQNETLTRKMLDNIEKNQFELNKNKLNKLYKIFR